MGKCEPVTTVSKGGSDGVKYQDKQGMSWESDTWYTVLLDNLNWTSLSIFVSTVASLLDCFSNFMNSYQYNFYFGWFIFEIINTHMYILNIIKTAKVSVALVLNFPCIQYYGTIKLNWNSFNFLFLFICFTCPHFSLDTKLVTSIMRSSIRIRLHIY